MVVVLYHANCNDGLFSAHQVWLKDKANTLCIPITYSKFNKQSTEEFIDGIKFLDESAGSDGLTVFDEYAFFSGFELMHSGYVRRLSETVLFLVDIVVDPAKLKGLSEIFDKVVVFDHHESAKDLYLLEFKDNVINVGIEHTMITPFPNTLVKFSNDQSGALFTHNQLNPHNEAPYYVQLVSDYDTWKKVLPESDSFAAGIRAMNYKSMQELDDAVNTKFDYIVNLGKCFNDDRQARSVKAIKHRIDIDIVHEDKTYRAAIVCSSLDISSIVGHILVNDHDYDIGISFMIVGPDEVGWSLRSSREVNSIFVSKSHGGGGHAQASGFSTNLTTLVDIISAKRMVIS